MFKLTISTVLLVLLFAGILFIVKTSQPAEYSHDTIEDNQNSSPSFELNMSAQNSNSTVDVKSVYLTEPGFIVLREVAEEKLGQIIEISDYLEKGEHNNIQVSLGDFYDGVNELVAIIYSDIGSDGVLNDLDTPALNASGDVVARYVKTGEVVPQSLLQHNNSLQQLHRMGNLKMETVRYTDQGFVPSQIDIEVGTMVQFINESDNDMWVASNMHPGHNILPTFDQFEATSKNSEYTYVFDKSGDWEYHDHINASYEGVVHVR